MVQVSLPQRRARAGMALLLASTAGVLMALALGYTLVLWAMLASAGLTGALLLWKIAPDRDPAGPQVAGFGHAPQARRDVWMADGTARQALIVPAQTADGYQTVLTIDGYALVNPEGRVVYALDRKLRADSSATNEPVIVTVLDEEVVAY